MGELIPHAHAHTHIIHIHRHRNRHLLPYCFASVFNAHASLPCSLLFTSNGTSVTFHKVNGQPSQSSMQASTQCSSKLDRVLAMAADPDSRRLFWVSLRYNRLILNWASYNRETCSNRCVCCATHMHVHIQDVNITLCGIGLCLCRCEHVCVCMNSSIECVRYVDSCMSAHMYVRMCVSAYTTEVYMYLCCVCMQLRT